MSRSVSVRSTIAGAAVLLAIALVAAGCSDRDLPPTSTASAPASAAPAPIPEPTASGGAPTLSADGGSGDESGDEDDDGSRVEPSAFPDWMTRPASDAPPCSAPTDRVSTADQLQAALDSAGPGTVIRLAAGTYVGQFVTTASGTAEQPARLCGPVDAVLDGGGQQKGYVLHLDGAKYWMVDGFTVRNGQKGLVADGTVGTTISGLTVYGTGDEAVHLRKFSTDNLVVGNTISDTGSRKPKFGEGIYIGTANSNWCDITDCDPDLSDRNTVTGNAVYATSSEPVDIKEGTSDGVLSGNQFDGSTISGADSWVDVKGNDWTVSDNVGRNSPMDGFQAHDVYDGWGTRNVFTGNSGSLTNGEGVLVALKPVNDNRVACDNRLLDGIGELSNTACH